MGDVMRDVMRQIYDFYIFSIWSAGLWAIGVVFPTCVFCIKIMQQQHQ